MSFPILYPKGTKEFSNLGLGVLSDCLKCTVTREINGTYELSIEYPVEGVHFNEIQTESIICAKVPDKDNYQAFKVYSISRPIDLTVTIDAEHVSYMTGDIPLKNFSFQGGGDLHGIDGILYAMTHTAIPEGIVNPFTLDSNLNPDYTVFTLKEPASMRQVMGADDEMLLSMDEYKDDEWDIDNFHLTLKKFIGEDKSDHIHYVYGVNVTDLSQDENLTNTVTGVLPYYYTEDDDGKPINVIGAVCKATGYENFSDQRIVATNVESYFTDEEKEQWNKDPATGIKMPTQEAVTAKGEDALKDCDFACKPEVSLRINPVDLTGISGYETVAESLKRVNLGDTITVIFKAYGINTKSRIVRVTYNVLEECNDSVEVGDPSPNLAATLAAIGDRVEVNRAGIIIGKDSILAYVDKANGELGSQLKMTEDEISMKVAKYADAWDMVPLTGDAALGGEGWTIELFGYGDPYTTNPSASSGYTYFDRETGYVWEYSGVEWSRKQFTKKHEFRYYGTADDYERKYGHSLVYVNQLPDPAEGLIYGYSGQTQSGGDIEYIPNYIYASAGKQELNIDYTSEADKYITVYVWERWLIKEIANIDDDAYTVKVDAYCESNIKQLGDEIDIETSRRLDGMNSVIKLIPGDLLLEASQPSDDPTDTANYHKASIRLRAKGDAGRGSEIDIRAATIQFNGKVVFMDDLKYPGGVTVIDGSYIKTGKIDADRINVDQLTAKKVQTNSDGSYYMTLMNGQLRTYKADNSELYYSIGTKNYPFTIGANGDLLFDGNWYNYLTLAVKNRAGVSGEARYMLPGLASGTIIRAYRPDGDWTVPEFTRSAIVSRFNLEYYPKASFADVDDGDVEDSMKSNRLKAVYWNSNKRRVMWRNARSGMGTEGVDYDKDDMGATTRYVKWYHDGGDDSDRRWKNSIESLDNIADDYMRLHPVSYKFNEGVETGKDKSQIHFGLIAQEVAEVYPDNVYYMVNHDLSSDNEDLSREQLIYTPAEYYKLRYEELHALHIAMIQKHEREITELKSMVKELLNLLQNDDH